MKSTSRAILFTLFILFLVFVSVSFVPSASAQKKKEPMPAPAAASQPIKLVVDATHASEKILHAEEQIAVTPGPVTLVFPKWIPGEHGPTGPVVDLTGLQFYAGSQRLAWRRDLAEMYAFHLNVPPGTNTLDVKLDLVMPAPPEGFSSGASSTTQLLMLSWNQVLLYLDKAKSDEVQVQASVRLPSGWKYGTALPVDHESNGQTSFKTVSLTTLIDSPVLASPHFRRIPLSPQGPIQHFLDMASDSDAALQVPPETVEGYKHLVNETGALFGARHYNEYHFLLTLSDHTAHFGLEHHQSSDDRVAERTLIEEAPRMLEASLLPHEMTHSWNGKYRRPAGLATSNYQKPMEGDLLWVYEGLTQYLGDVLAARSGIWTDEQYRGMLAQSAAMLDNWPGREWRNLQDTATMAQVLYDSGGGWDNWRRGVDFYAEGELV